MVERPRIPYASFKKKELDDEMAEIQGTYWLLHPILIMCLDRGTDMKKHLSTHAEASSKVICIEDWVDSKVIIIKPFVPLHLSSVNVISLGFGSCWIFWPGQKQKGFILFIFHVLVNLILKLLGVKGDWIQNFWQIQHFWWGWCRLGWICKVGGVEFFQPLCNLPKLQVSQIVKVPVLCMLVINFCK